MAGDGLSIFASFLPRLHHRDPSGKLRRRSNIFFLIISNEDEIRVLGALCEKTGKGRKYWPAIKQGRFNHGWQNLRQQIYQDKRRQLTAWVLPINRNTLSCSPNQNGCLTGICDFYFCVSCRSMYFVLASGSHSAELWHGCLPLSCHSSPFEFPSSSCFQLPRSSFQAQETSLCVYVIVCVHVCVPAYMNHLCGSFSLFLFQPQLASNLMQ